MCVILHIQPNSEIPKEKLLNAIWNNEDGYGILIRKKKRGKYDDIEVIKNPRSPSDPKEILEILNNNKKHEMMLHVRNATKGVVSKENCHPYTVYEPENKRGPKIYFSHNGTFYQYGDAEKSDSLDFCQKILVPLFEELKDLDFNNSKIVELILDKCWMNEQVNKGLLFSNNQPALEIGRGWISIGEGIRASNNSYFDRLQRGQEFETRKRISEEKLAAERKARISKENNSDNNGFPKSDPNDFRVDFNRIPTLSGFDADESATVLNELFEQDEMTWDLETLCILSALTTYEIADIVQADYDKVTDKHDGHSIYSCLPAFISALLVMVAKAHNDQSAMEQDIDEMRNTIDVLEEKNKRAGRMVSTILQKSNLTIEEITEGNVEHVGDSESTNVVG